LNVAAGDEWRVGWEANMASISVRPRLGWAFVAWLLLLYSATVAGAQNPVVQQIGEVRGRIAEAVAEEAVAAGVTVVPFSPRLDARATSIILAPGKVFLARNGKRVLGLRPAEQAAIREAYDAGQVILLLDVSTHDIEALHVLLEDGVAHESTTDPVVLAYALRQENGVPSARLVTHPAVDVDPDEHELALSRALEIVVEELTRPPAAPEDAPAAGDVPDWKTTPVQKFILTSTDNGVYNTPVDIYALHACDENKDYYVVNTGGDWTATQARYESADADLGEITANPDGSLNVEWTAGDAHCAAGGDVDAGAQFICRYMNYPLTYEIDILPPSGPTVVQVNAVPAGDQGVSASYESGFSFSIDGEVEVSGEGPIGGLQAGVSWDNTVSTPVPPLAIEAGIKGNEGAFTTYRYCTVGSDANCTSTIQMVGPGICQHWIVGPPQQGQTPEGRLSNVAQTVYWQVDPSTYTGATFDITVTWTVALAVSTSKLWNGLFQDRNSGNVGPTGNCNVFGCSCGIESASTPMTISHTFTVKPPSSSQCPP
jgi:hypothetical protein